MRATINVKDSKALYRMDIGFLKRSPANIRDSRAISKEGHGTCYIAACAGVSKNQGLYGI